MGSKLYLILSFSLLFFYILISSCIQPSQKYPGYIKVKDGLYTKLDAFTGSNRKCRTDEFIQVKLEFKTNKDSVFWTSTCRSPFGFQIYSYNELTTFGLLGQSMKDSNEGDSLTLMIDASNLFKNFFKSNIPYFISKTELLKIEIKLDNILTKAQYNTLINSCQQSLEQWENEETIRIKNYIQKINRPVFEQPNGSYYIPIKEGQGAKIIKGNKVSISYQGSYLNGTLIDNVSANEPFDYTVGEEYQIIEGLDDGIKLMREGDEAKFIIPSHLAFGKGGSTNGIIPPYTTLVYYVKILNVKK